MKTAEPLEFARLRPHTERVRFALADAYSLPAELGKFDATFAGLWLSHVPIARRPRFLASLHAVHRVLKNFPTRDAPNAMIRGIGVEPDDLMLENLWLFEYIVAEDRSPPHRAAIGDSLRSG